MHIQQLKYIQHTYNNAIYKIFIYIQQLTIRTTYLQ